MRVIAKGATTEIGAVEETPTISMTDFSRRETDEFGVTTVVRRGFNRKLSVRLKLASADVDALQRRLADLRATSAAWIADDRFAWLSIVGFFKDFSIDLAGPAGSFCTLSVEGLAETGGVADNSADPAYAGASTFQMLQPAPVTDAMLVGSEVAENDAPAWATGTTYAEGARVIRASTHRVYESLQAANAGKTPESEPSWWLDIGPTNRWAMFDDALGTSTTRTGGLEVTLNGGTANALSLIDVAGDSVRVRASGYDRTQPVRDGAMTFAGLPGAGQVIVNVIGAQVAIGTLLIGRMVGLGVTEISPTAGITDFSRKEADEFGEVKVVERAWSKTMSARTLIRTSALDIVADRIAAMRARPVLWIGQDGQDAITIFGFFKDFSIEVGPSVSKLSLSIEGLSQAAPVVPLTVPWTNVTDPAKTKPDDNATNSADPKSPFGPGGTVDDAQKAIAAAKARQDEMDNVFIPAINKAVDDAGKRITEARGRADDAYGRADQAIANADAVDRRVDRIIVDNGTADEALRAEIERIDEAAIGREGVIARSVETLSASYTSGGNMLSNTDFTVDAAGWTFRSESGSIGARNGLTSTQWWPARMNALVISQENTGTGRAGYWFQDVLGLVPGETYQSTVYAGAHRCVAGVYLEVFDAGGGILSTFSATMAGEGNAGSGQLSDYNRVTCTFVAPPSSVWVRAFLIKYGTMAGSNSYAWFVRPQLTRVHAGVTAPVPYTPGSGDAGRVATDARISREVTTLAEADAALARETTAVEARVSNAISASAREVTTAFAEADRGLASRSATLEAAVFDGPTRLVDLSARIKSNSDAFADLPNRYATASRAATLEAQLANAADSGLRAGLAARIEDRATVIADEKAGAVAQTVSNLRTEYNQTKADLEVVGSVASDAYGRSRAFLRQVAVAGSNRAQLTLYADSNGGAGVDIIGDVAITGNLLVNGTVNSRSFNGATMVREVAASWTGSIRPREGQTATVPWSLTVPAIPPLGRFIYEYRISIQTNAGQSQPSGTDDRGRPITIHYIGDGGVSVSASDPQGNVYRPAANSSQRVLAQQDFTPTFTATVTRGSQYRVEDGGDYVSILVSAYYEVNLIDLKVTWVAI